MLELQNNYDGKSEGKQKKHVDRDDLKMLSYRKKTTLYLEKYITQMRQKFNVLDNSNVPLYEEDKIRKLLDHINSPNNYFKTEVNICRSIHSARFNTAFIYLSTVILRLYRQPRHHQEDIDRDGRSIHLGQEEEGAEADYLKEEQAAVEVVEEAMEDKAKEIKIKVKIGLT